MNTSISGLLISGLLILFGIALYAGQRRNLAELTEGAEDQKISSLRAFLIRQARRRMQTGFLFVLAGIAIFAGFQIIPQVHPNLSAGIWFLTIVFLLWAILLTIIDIFEIRLRLNEEKSVEEAARKGLEYLRKRNEASESPEEPLESEKGKE